MNYTPLTSETRVKDFEIADTIELGGEDITLPESIKRKDPHYLLEGEQAIRAIWISPVLAHLLNAKRWSGELKIKELLKAKQAVEERISALIKYDVLRDKHSVGAMAFCQANENVPSDCILISQRSYDTLCSNNKRWLKTRTVIVTRYPNLGPNTTKEMKLMVNKPEGLDSLMRGLSSNSLGMRCDLSSLFEEEEADTSGIVDAFYLNPEVLENDLKGDGDGDVVYLTIERHGSPMFRTIDLTREADSISDEHVAMLFKKAGRVERKDLAQWLPPYFDDIPIGPATYSIRWKLYNTLPQFKSYDHPMHHAWNKIAPSSIVKMEQYFDIRKGDLTEKQINKNIRELNTTMKDIKTAKSRGDWFARTVTSSHVEDIDAFSKKFKTMQSYVIYITKGSNVKKAK